MSDAFWQPWEKVINSFDDALQVVHDVFDGWSKKGRRFAWRGQVNAAWGLDSSLYRRLTWTKDAEATTTKRRKGAPTEAELQKEEEKILTEAHRWGLHTGERGRLSVLSQLAVLQHYGTPTRLIDITFNPLIGLWFAVEEQRENGESKSDDDGRLFAIDVTHRLINEQEEHRGWEDKLRRPWPRESQPEEHLEWTTTAFAWKPARLDHRIAAQNGGFLLGGVPSSGDKAKPNQWPKAPSSPGNWKIDEVRRALSVSLHVNKIDSQGGKPPHNPVYTLRITGSKKAEIRKRLEHLYGYSHATIFRDYSGFALYGHRALKSRP